MFDPSDGEIMGGLGFGDDEYPSSYNYHTDFSLYSNGSGPLNKDPYLPIENEKMGRDWASSEFGSSDPKSTNPYEYRDVYTPKDFMLRDDYYLDSPNAPRSKNGKPFNNISPMPSRAKIDNSATVKEYLMTNFPTFHSIDPMTGEPAATGAAGGTVVARVPNGSCQRKPQIQPGTSNYVFMIFIVMVFVLLIIMSYLQHTQIIKLYKIIKEQAKK
jgi:hypothetical protein